MSISGRTLDGACFPLCLWISKPDNADNALWSTIKPLKDKSVLEVNVRVSTLINLLLL